jgi:hypothetical protein
MNEGVGCQRLMLVFCFLASPLAAQGGLAGRVVDQATGRPVAGAEVLVMGTRSLGLADADGRYQIVAIPAGSQVFTLAGRPRPSTKPATTTQAA